MARRDSEASAINAADPIFEEIRRASLRSFRVRKFNGEIVDILAHYHNGGEGPFLNFVVVDPSGRQSVVRMINAQAVEDVEETTKAGAQQHLARLQTLAARKYRELVAALDPDVPQVQKTPRSVM